MPELPSLRIVNSVRACTPGLALSLAWMATGCGAPARDDVNHWAAGGASSGGSSSSAGGTATGLGGTASSGASTSGGTTGSSGGNSGGNTANGGNASGGTSNGGSAPNAAGGTTPYNGGTATGDPGVWENVTPAGVNTDPSYVPGTNFGIMDILADPARPSDLYAFICYQGIWRSTDYGVTWMKVSTGTNAAVLETGRPWTAAIDNDPQRDPSTPPALYTANGYGSQAGVFKSTDWGVNWTKYYENQDIYSLTMDPYDNQHLITGMHEAGGIAETTDGGVTWNAISTGSIGSSIYPFFIDTGSADTTANTWLAVPQVDSGSGAAVTTNGGTSFTTAGDGFDHPHGGNQAFIAGPSTTFAGGSGGVWRTLNSGASWDKMFSAEHYPWSSGVVGTASLLYSWCDGANAGGIGDPHFYTAPRDPGDTWTAMTTPPEMNNGGKNMAVTFDGTHYVLVSGNWNAGIWRYVEP